MTRVVIAVCNSTYLFAGLPGAELVGQAAPLDQVLELVLDINLLGQVKVNTGPEGGRTKTVAASSVLCSAATASSAGVLVRMHNPRPRKAQQYSTVWFGMI